MSCHRRRNLQELCVSPNEILNFEVILGTWSGVTTSPSGLLHSDQSNSPSNKRYTCRCAPTNIVAKMRTPRHGCTWGTWRLSLHASLLSVPNGDDWLASRLRRFTPRGTALGTYCNLAGSGSGGGDEEKDPWTEEYWVHQARFEPVSFKNK